jgi:hypothetical protein
LKLTHKDLNFTSPLHCEVYPPLGNICNGSGGPNGAKLSQVVKETVRTCIANEDAYIKQWSLCPRQGCKWCHAAKPNRSYDRDSVCGNCRIKDSHARHTEGSGYDPSVSREVFSDKNNADFLAFGGPTAEDAYMRLTDAFGWLSEVEVMMVASFVPRLQITYKLNGQTGYKGHLVTFYNNASCAISRLPCPPGQLPLVLLVLTGKKLFLKM